MPGTGGLKNKSQRRFVFTIKKDLVLLKTCLQHNPWQLGEEIWEHIRLDAAESFRSNLSIRTLKDQVSRLVDQYRTQQLQNKTGTEKEKTERGDLLESIIAIIEEAESSINVELGSEKLQDNSDIFYLDDVSQIVEAEKTQTQNGDSLIKQRLQNKKIAADTARNELLASASDYAPDPHLMRRKRSRLSPEDELIKVKLEHDSQLEGKRIELQNDKQQKDFELECRKLELEEKKFQLEMEREKRIDAEGKRRDEMMSSQISFQNNMYQLMLSIAQKKD